MLELSHAELVASIVGECKRRRLACQVTPAERVVCKRCGHVNYTGHPGNCPGWVDLVILGRGGALFVEVKVQDGRRTLAQVQIEGTLATARLSYRLWRPEHWASGEIVRELDAIA